MKKRNILDSAQRRLQQSTRTVRIQVGLTCANAAVSIYKSIANEKSAAVDAAVLEAEKMTSMVMNGNASVSDCASAVKRCEKFMVDEDDMNDVLLDSLQDNAFSALALAYLCIGEDKRNAAHGCVLRLLDSIEQSVALQTSATVMTRAELEAYLTNALTAGARRGPDRG